VRGAGVRGAEAVLDALRERWGTALGQRWQVGRHTVTCADARDMTPPDQCLTLVFDPPWDADVPTPERWWTSALVFTSGRHIGRAIERFGAGVAWQFVWDGQCCHARTNLPFQRHKSCLWYGDVRAYRWRGARLDGVPDRPQGKKLSDLYAKPLHAFHAATPHQHAKPLEWVRCLIGNCADGDVFDSYLGSGTTLLACEATGRACHGVEIDPRFVALTLEQAKEAGLCPIQI
jgi:hypothetical protein